MLAIYLQGLIPTAVDQDSGELVAAAHVLGIAHPTGYPLWVMLAKLFDLLPIGHTSAYRVALLSAVCSAAAGGMLSLLALRLTGSIVPAVCAGLGFGLWNPTWSQAVRAEVYGLTGLLFAWLLLSLARWSEVRRWQAAYGVSLACGFVAMHHRTAFLAGLPPLIAALSLTRPRRGPHYLLAGLLFLAPFACYAYLPVRASARPPVNWTDPSTLERFLAHVKGTQYLGFAFSHTPSQMWEQAVKLLPEVLAPSAALAAVLALLGVPLAAWGCWWWGRRDRALAWSLGAGAALLVLWVLQWGETTDLKVFLLPLGAVGMVCVAAGLRQLEIVLGGERKRASWAGRGLVRRVLPAGVAVLLWATLMASNWARCDLSERWGYRDQWAAALLQMEPGAIFVSDHDVPSFMTMYLQNVEGLRRDVTLVRTVGVMQEWYLDLIEDAELREVLRTAWAQVSRELGVVSTGTPEFWEGSARLAAKLSEHYRGRRPVYAVHGPLRPTEGPPYFVGLSHDLVAVQFSRPRRVVRAPGRPLVRFDGVGELVSYRWLQEGAAPGELVTIVTDWHLYQQTRPMQFVVGLIPEGMSLEEFAAQPADKWQAEVRLAQAFPIGYGDLQLAPSAAGTAYRQPASFIIPTNAPAGRYRTAVCVTPLYSPVYRGWVEVGPGVEIAPRQDRGSKR